MRVLIALDNDEDAQGIVASVAPWLRHAEGTAILLRVMDAHDAQRTVARAEGYLPVAPDDEPRMAMGLQEPQTQSVEDRTQAIDRVESVAREQLARLAAKSLPGIAHEVHVALGSDAADTIVKEARALHADAIAIGTHGRSGLRHNVLGSVAEAVVRASPVPLFLVGQTAQPSVDGSAAEDLEQAEAAARGRRVADHREEEVDPLALNALIDSHREDP
jgi:nucleotide-binding universal stress UspA family protein